MLTDAKIRFPKNDLGVSCFLKYFYKQKRGGKYKILVEIWKVPKMTKKYWNMSASLN